MKPAAFTYHRAHDVADAVGLLSDLAAASEDPKLIAGGQSLVADDELPPRPAAAT